MACTRHQSPPCPCRRTGHLEAPVLAGTDNSQTWLGKEQEGEIQQARRGPDSSMSSAPAAGREPGIGSSERSPAALMTHWPLRLLPSVKALGSAAAARRSERT